MLCVMHCSQDGCLALSPLYTCAGYVTVMYSEQFAASMAAALCVVSIGVVLLCVPETTKDPTSVAGTADSYSESP